MTSHSTAEQELNELRDREFRWRFAIEGSGDGLWDANLDTGKIFFSAGWKSMLGYAEHEVGGERDEWLSRIHPDDLERALAAVRAVQDPGMSLFTTECRMRCKNGEWLWVLSRGVVASRAASGAPLRLIGTNHDISDRKTVEEALRASEEAYRLIADRTSDGIIVFDAEQRITYASPAYLRQLGYTLDEQLARSAADVRESVHSEDHGVFASIFAAIARKENELRYSYRVRTKLGSYIWREDEARFQYDAAGQYTGAYVVCRDITERVQAEATRRLESAALEAAANAILITDRDGITLRVNDAFTVLTGYTAEEAVGRTPGSLLRSGAQSQEFYRQMWDTILSGSTWTGELLNQRKNGTQYNVEVTITPLRSEDGSVTHFIAIKQDITARRLLEEQLRQSLKMESVGRLAGGVAHDFNNMLGVIFGHTELALAQLDPSQQLHGDLLEIHKAAKRSADLTRHLLAFARKQTVLPQVIDVNEIITNGLRLLQRLIGEDIQLTWKPQFGLGQVFMDPSQLDQILANLCVNARDAIADVGSLTITTANVDLDAAFCAAHALSAPGPFVRLSVSDSGCGMSADVMARIFEPFFTTKAVGEGTGLGLATVYGAVAQNGGCITVSSTAGVGSRFDIFLPRSLKERPGTVVPGLGAPARQGKETILVVEDEPAVLKLVARALEGLGYSVLRAAGPAEALRLAREHSGDIHLILTDVIMPKLNGLELATTLAPLFPNAQCLFMSGYSADVLASHGVRQAPANIIRKPFSIEALAGRIRALLDGTEQPELFS